MERKTVLITGINGFAASHLAKYLVEEGHDVHGTIRVRSDLHRLEGIKDKITLHLIELSDPFSVSNVLKEVRPEEIYHLAAQSYVKSSWTGPIETFSTTVLGTINLFEQIRNLDYKPNVLVTSTSEIYGEKVGDIDENTIPEPNTPYGISKYTQDMLARMYHRAYGMNVVLSRSFNVTGEGRADVFVDSNFAKQVVEVEKGIRDVIKHGNLNSARDFTDIQDVVRGYAGIMRSGKWGEVFCLASGEPVKIQTVLDTLLRLAKVEVRTEIDPERMRPVDTKSMKGISAKAFKEFGWKKTIPLETSLNNLLNYWRKKL